MEKRSRNLIIGLLAVVLTAALVWGVVESVQRRAYRLHLNAMLERSFYELVGGLGDMEVKLDKLAVSDGAREDVLLLSELYRQADGAAQNLGALPVERDGINAAMKFVNQIADYSAALNEGIAQGRPISDTDVGQLQSIQERLSEMNSIVYDMDALDNWAGGDSAEIDMSAIARENLSYPTLIYDGPFSDGARGGFKGLGTDKVDEQAALEVARQYAGGEPRLTGRTGSPVPGYEIVCATEAGELELFVSETGGRVLYMLPSYDMVSQEVSAGAAQDVQGAIRIATQYLRERGFAGMAANYTQRSEGAVVINFTATQGGVTLYPDLVKVQVSLETGLVIGVESNNYLRNHVPRTFPQNPLTADEARALVHTLEVESVRPVLIPRNGQEIFCYEIRGTHEGQTYLVYLDAVTGRTQDILQVVLTDDGEQVL